MATAYRHRSKLHNLAAALSLCLLPAILGACGASEGGGNRADQPPSTPPDAAWDRDMGDVLVDAGAPPDDASTAPPPDAPDVSPDGADAQGAADAAGAADATVQDDAGDAGDGGGPPLPPSLSFCQLAPYAGPAIPLGQGLRLEVVLYAEGRTPGPGAGQGVAAELGIARGAASLTELDWRAMAHERDTDGLVPGDLANDVFGLDWTPSESGRFGFVARARLADGPGAWVYCDTRGLGDGTDASVWGQLEVLAPPVPQVGYCQTETPSVVLGPDEGEALIAGHVYVEGRTVGAGAAAGVEAELVRGPVSESPDTWTDLVVADYLGDADGLQPGDLANDRYEARVILGADEGAGEWAYAFRFRAQPDQPWSWCDVDGSDGSPEGFDPSQLGRLTRLADPPVVLAEDCLLQFPHFRRQTAATPTTDVYVRLASAGRTGLGVAPGPDVKVEVLLGPGDAEPVGDAPEFQSVTATWNPSAAPPGWDEFSAAVPTPAEGMWALAGRVSVDGGQNWRLCDTAGASPFDPGRMAALEVLAQPAEEVDYCRVWQTSMDGSAAGTGPLITVELYEAGWTDNNGGFNAGAFEVESGFGPRGYHPALPALYRWQTGTMSYKGLRPGHPNNYEYEGLLWSVSDAPAPGLYSALVRVRRAGETAWTYCDTDENTIDLQLGRLTAVDVNP